MGKRVTFIIFTVCFVLFSCKVKAKDNTPEGLRQDAREENVPSINDEPIKISYFISSPHIFFNEETKTISGALYDMIEHHIGPAMGEKFQWDSEPTTIPREIALLKMSQRYIVSLLAYVPEREEFAIYSAKPYFSGQSSITIQKENPIQEIRRVEDINHMVFGYAADSYMSPFMRDPSIKWDLISTADYHAVNLKKVLLNRIDAVYAPGRGSMLVQLTELGLLDQFRMVNLPEEPVPYYVVFSLDLADFAKRFDETFEELGGKEFYRTLLSKYVDISLL